ncbi:MAG: nucleotide exchange factor GrpE [Coriobacteriia bacterium]|nr:nucleotide exchange factor GrpE [Coriobacteriia bacterium]
MVARRGKHSANTDEFYENDEIDNGAGAADKAARGAARTSGGQPTDPAASEAAAARAAAADAAAVEELLEELKAAVGEVDAEGPNLLVMAQAEAEEYRDRFLRLQAEWDNFRKRTDQERVQERQRAAEGLVERLLPVMDDLERAIAHSDSASVESLKGGIEAVYNKLQDVLKKEGVKVLDPEGEAFDALLHQAVGKQTDESVPDETVAQVYQKGYEMGGRVLRSAMVVVTEGGPKRESEDAVDGE